jgi:DNA-binding transcriptional regulator YiaG
MNPKEFREIRERLALTQKDLAELLGLSGYMPVNHYESGFRNPSVLIMAIMRLLDEWPEKKSMAFREDLKSQIERLKKKHPKNSS